MTPAQARTVAQTWLHGSYGDELAQERGALQAIDKAFDRLRTPGPEPTPDLRVHDDVIWVAHQAQYPITFLCYDKPHLAGGQTNAGQLFRFSKASASAPWTVTHQDLLLSLGSKPAVAVDSTGYAQLVSAQDYGKLAVSPAKLARDWAAYLQAANASDAREFAPGRLTTDQITTGKQLITQNASKHYTVTMDYAPTDDPVDAYVLRDGGALVLVGLQLTTHIVATGDPIKVTDDGKGVSAPAPGSYRSITNTVLVLATFTVPPKGSAVKVSGVGAYFGPVSSIGTKA